MNTASLNIRHLRKRYQLTQEQMARKLGIKRSLLGAYEESRANPRLEVLVKVAELFNVSVDQLVSDSLGASSGESQLKKEGADEKQYSGGRDTKHLQRVHQPTSTREQSKRPYLPPRKIDFPSSDTKKKKTLQRLCLVPAKAFKQYFFNALDPEYLESLSELILPLPSSVRVEYRAFELADHAMHPIRKGTIVVGRKIDDIQNIKDGKAHILITRTEGILFRHVFNHIESSGELLLEAKHKEYEPMKLSVLGKEVEAWEVELYIADEANYQFLSPQNEQVMDLASLTTVVHDLQKEVISLKRKLDELI